MNDQLLATYDERTPTGWRRFTLFADRVAVEGKQRFGAEFRTVVALAVLYPEPGSLRLRDKSFSASAACIVLGGLLALLGVFTVWAARREPTAPAIAGWPLVVAGVAPLLWGLITAGRRWRKIRYATFNAGAGGVLLDVADAGPDGHRFDAFVAQVVEQIHAVRAAHASAARAAAGARDVPPQPSAAPAEPGHA